MTVTPIYAPAVPFYANREPYITVDEFLNSPVGVDTSQLIPGASAAANKDALAAVIGRASSIADTYCYGPGGCLAATVDVQPAPPEGWRIQRRSGRSVIAVPCDYTPVIAVTGVSLGYDPSTVTALTDLTGVWPSRKVVTIPVSGWTSVPAGAAPGTGPAPAYMGGRLWGTVQYINGWFNATLSAATLAGATSITPTDVNGLYPGLQVTIYETSAAHTEQATVAASYTPGTATVPLAAPLANAHAAGASVTALPPAVRQAVISLTSALIKRRGGESIVLQAINDQVTRDELGEPGLSADEKLACRLLAPFRRAR